VKAARADTAVFKTIDTTLRGAGDKAREISEMTDKPDNSTSHHARKALPRARARLGSRPVLQWIPIGELSIDATYQRAVRGAGEKLVSQIAERFDWGRFGVLFVTPSSDGRGYAVIDGQHRLAAARARGDIDALPASIISADRPLDTARQAELFVSINGDRLAGRPITLFWAAVHQGEPVAVSMVAICRDAGVTIARYQGVHHEPATTSAIAALRAAVVECGGRTPILTAALRALVEAQRLGTEQSAPAGPPTERRRGRPVRPPVDGLMMGGNAIRAAVKAVAAREGKVSIARLGRAILSLGEMAEQIDLGRAARRAARDARAGAVAGRCAGTGQRGG
jgi:hypothetical protein